MNNSTWYTLLSPPISPQRSHIMWITASRKFSYNFRCFWSKIFPSTAKSLVQICFSLKVSALVGRSQRFTSKGRYSAWILIFLPSAEENFFQPIKRIYSSSVVCEAAFVSNIYPTIFFLCEIKGGRHCWVGYEYIATIHVFCKRQSSLLFLFCRVILRRLDSMTSEWYTRVLITSKFVRSETTNL